MPKEITCAGTLIEHDNRILILCRNRGKPHGGLWGLPGGKAEENESVLDAAIRETFQETGHKARPNELEFIGLFRFKFPEVVSNYHAFSIKLDHKINVRINPKEHSAYEWINPDICYNRANLILGLRDVLEKKYGITPKN